MIVFIVFFVVVFLLVLGWLLFVRQTPSGPTKEELSSIQAAAATIEDSGFSPATLRVPVNTQVTFTNNTDTTRKLEPAPTTPLENFDPEEVAKSESVSYIFEQTGRFVIQDANDPDNFHIEVVVE
jgi:plastocyanin